MLQYQDLKFLENQQKLKSSREEMANNSQTTKVRKKQIAFHRFFLPTFRFRYDEYLSKMASTSLYTRGTMEVKQKYIQPKFFFSH